MLRTNNLLGLIGMNPMDPFYVPTYYQPDSILEVQIANSTVVRYFKVVRPLTPFTMAQVIVVRDTNDPESQEIPLKVYDPRFMIIPRKGMKKAWDA